MSFDAIAYALSTTREIAISGDRLTISALKALCCEIRALAN